MVSKGQVNVFDDLFVLFGIAGYLKAEILQFKHMHPPMYHDSGIRVCGSRSLNRYLSSIAQKFKKLYFFLKAAGKRAKIVAAQKSKKSLDFLSE